MQPTAPGTDQIASMLTMLYGHTVRGDEIKPLNDGGPTPNTIDRTGKFIAPAREGGVCFLLLSSPANPDVVARGVRNIDEIGARLSPCARKKLLKPLDFGNFDGVSYALWPMLRPLSRNRLVQPIQKRRLAPKILNWLYDVAATSSSVNDSTAHINESFIKPLTTATNHHGLSAKIQKTANSAIQRINSGHFQPANCVQHGDFWLGNIMLPGPDTPGQPQFVVIDWGGANHSGYPFADLANMALSLNISKTKAVGELHRHCALLKCDPKDSLSYLVCAIGSLSQNLEYFPEEKFVEMAEALFEYQQALIATN